MAVIQYAVLNDVHFPLHSVKGYTKALHEMSRFPDLREIFLNGDIMEVESVSSHPKTPSAQKSLLREVDYVNDKFDSLAKLFPKTPVHYICGNHEYRIYRFIRDIAPEMFGMITEPKLFRFDERIGFKFYDYGPTQWVKCGKANDLWLRHEPLVMGTNCAKGTAEKSLVNVLFGHTHIYQQYTHKKMGPIPKNVTATSCGWLGDISQACFDYRGNRDNWQLMFTRIDCDEKTGEYEIRPIFL